MGTTLSLPLKGTTVNDETSGYRQLNIVGGVDLTNATLDLTSDLFQPAVGDRFVIVNNDGSDPVVGNFIGLLNNTLIPNFRGTGHELRVSYAEDATTPNTAGNDVVLTLVEPEINVVNSDDSALSNPEVFGPTTVGAPVTRQFKIQNLGGGTLNISGITVTNPANYEVSGVPATVAPGLSATFSVKLLATSSGTFLDDVVIASDDASEPSVSFAITGTVNEQAVVVSDTVVVTLGNSSVTPYSLTISVPPAPNDNKYYLTRSAGVWSFTEGGGITGNATATLVIEKSVGLTKVDISDSSNVGSAVTSVIFEGRGSVTTAGARTFEDSFNVDLDSVTGGTGTVTFTGNCEFVGDAALAVETLRNIESPDPFFIGYTTSVENGDLTLIGNAAGTTSGTFLGVSIEHTFVSKGDGEIVITGQGGNTGVGSANYGVSVSNAKVASQGTGPVTLTGAGGAVSGAGTQLSRGVLISGVSGGVESASGTIKLRGSSQAADGASGGFHQGILIQAGANIRSTNPANAVVIDIQGSGAGGTNLGSDNYGVSIRGTGTLVSTTLGSISIVGNGGLTDNGDANHGINLESDAVISSLGTATVTLTGTGGTGDDENYGVYLNAAANTVNGLMTITGTGGGDPDDMVTTSIDNQGVRMGGATLATSGTGLIDVIGIAGDRVGSEGFVIFATAYINSTGTGNVNVTANRIKLGAGEIALGSNSLFLKPYVARSVRVGLDDTVGMLGLSNAELNRVSSGTIVVGDLVNTNSIMVQTEPPPFDFPLISLRSNVNLHLIAQGDITQSASDGSITTTGTGEVTFTTGAGKLKPIFAGTDVTTGNGSDVNLVDTKLDISINGTTANDEVGGYRQLKVVGEINLMGTQLIVTGNFAGAALGDSFIIVDNDGDGDDDAVTGTFTGYSQGAQFTPGIPGSVLPVFIDYEGGDGNDIELVVGAPDIQLEQPATVVLGPTPLTYNFGIIATGNPNATRVFTIRNVGESKLFLGTLFFQSPSDPEFTLVAQPASTTLLPDSPGDSTTFTIVFKPTTVGDFDAQLRIPSSDPDENPYIINFIGQGGPAPVLSGLGDSVLTGLDAPDSTGMVSIGKFGPLIRGAYLAENGTLVFPGELAHSVSPLIDDNNDYGLWKSDFTNQYSLKLLARTGDEHLDSPGYPNVLPYPPATELYDLLPEIPAINRTGQVSFVARIRGDNVTTANDTGLWSESGVPSNPQMPLLVAREGDTVEGSTILGFGSGGTSANAPLSSAAGWATAQLGDGSAEVAFSATLSGPATAILRYKYLSPSGAEGPKSIVAKQGTPAGATGLNFGNLAGNFSDPVRMDEAGNIAFGAQLSNGGFSAWYQPRAGSLTKIAVPGDTAPDTTATFKELQAPTMGTDGYVSFRGLLNNVGDNFPIAMGEIVGPKNDGIWGGKPSIPGDIHLLLRRGWFINADRTVTPVQVDGVMKAGNPWGGWLTRNGSNRGAWRGWVDLNGDGKLSTRNVGDVHGIYANTDGTMRLIAAEGDLAPGGLGAFFASFDHPVAGGQNQVAFIASMGGVNNMGVWRQAPNGGPLSLIIRTGQQIPVEVDGVTTPRTIIKLSLPGAEEGVLISGTRRIEQPVMDGTGRMIIFVTVDGNATTQVLVP